MLLSLQCFDAVGRVVGRASLYDVCVYCHLASLATVYLGVTVRLVESWAQLKSVQPSMPFV